ncbi:MAG: histidine phosphatase family protein [Candidatus Methylomirabilia bacterium]
MRLILIRHADAGDPDPHRYSDDHLRPLIPQGRRDHEVVARALARMGCAPSHLLTSPLRRARETAEITAQALGWAGRIEAVDTLGDQFSVAGLLDHLARLPEDATVVAVGHEPHLSEFAGKLLDSEGAPTIVLRKSGVIGLECAGKPAPGGGRLLFLLPARELLRLLS